MQYAVFNIKPTTYNQEVFIPGVYLHSTKILFGGGQWVLEL